MVGMPFYTIGSIRIKGDFQMSDHIYQSRFSESYDVNLIPSGHCSDTVVVLLKHCSFEASIREELGLQVVLLGHHCSLIVAATLFSRA